MKQPSRAGSAPARRNGPASLCTVCVAEDGESENVTRSEKNVEFRAEKAAIACIAARHPYGREEVERQC